MQRAKADSNSNMAYAGNQGRRSDSRTTDRTPPARGDTTEKVVFINRCAKVVKGGRRFSFRGVMWGGDKDAKSAADLARRMRSRKRFARPRKRRASPWKRCRSMR